MSNANDAGNPLLSTPVATIAAQLMTDFLRQNVVPLERVADLVNANINCAEALVDALQEKGHLPRTVEVEEPKADDATLVLQAMMLGAAAWHSYGDGDPRGVLYVGHSPGANGFMTKLVKGVPVLDEDTRDRIKEVIAPMLRRL